MQNWPWQRQSALMAISKLQLLKYASHPTRQVQAVYGQPSQTLQRAGRNVLDTS